MNTSFLRGGESTNKILILWERAKWIMCNADELSCLSTSSLGVRFYGSYDLLKPSLETLHNSIDKKLMWERMLDCQLAKLDASRGGGRPRRAIQGIGMCCLDSYVGAGGFAVWSLDHHPFSITYKGLSLPGRSSLPRKTSERTEAALGAPLEELVMLRLKGSIRDMRIAIITSLLVAKHDSKSNVLKYAPIDHKTRCGSTPCWKEMVRMCTKSLLVKNTVYKASGWMGCTASLLPLWHPTILHV
jgi:hypothetical protein